MIIKILTVVSLLFLAHLAKADSSLSLSKKVYSDVPFSSQFSESGALIRNVNYDAVKELIPQLEALYNVKLENRGEAHITVLTPPEAQGWNTNGIGVNSLISTEEIQHKYSPSLQDNSFEVICVGSRKSQNKRVFFLVVDTPDLIKVRKEIQRELESRAGFANTPVYFDANDYWPHITIGYVGDDVHGVTKGRESCLEKVSLKFVD